MNRVATLPALLSDIRETTRRCQLRRQGPAPEMEHACHSQDGSIHPHDEAPDDEETEPMKIIIE